MNQKEVLLEVFRSDPKQALERFLESERQREQLTQELRQAEGQIQQTQTDLQQTQGDLQQAQLDLVEAKAFIAELTRQLFGQKADKLSAEQEEQLKEVAGDLQEESQRPPPISQQCLEEELEGKDKLPKERRARKRHPFPLTLERVTVMLEPDLPPCPPGGVYRKIGEEVTEELEFIPAKLILKRTVRPKYAASWSESGILIAPLPPRLFPQSKLGLGLAVFITLSRFDDHLSYYKLEQNFRERYGVVISRQLMVQWIEQIALWLQPIYNAIWELMKAGDYLQIDETKVRVLDPEVKGKAGTGWLWFYSVPGADAIVEFSPSRGQAVPKKRLEGFSGTIQADAYEVYPCIQRDLPGIKRNGCLAHSRRKFYKAALEGDRQAIWFIAQIRRLYRVEKECREMAPEQRQKYREEKGAREIWKEMKAKACELQPKLLPKSSLGKAISYFLDEYEPLLGYLREGKFEIDNNLCENSIRPVAVGRKRWLFLGHPEAGWRSAVIYSIIISCRRRGINPQEYLTDVLRRLPSMKASEVIDLVPSRWKPKPLDTG
jgi:transposase